MGGERVRAREREREKGGEVGVNSYALLFLVREHRLLFVILCGMKKKRIKPSTERMRSPAQPVERSPLLRALLSRRGRGRRFVGGPGRQCAEARQRCPTHTPGARGPWGRRRRARQFLLALRGW